ncbi:MAG: hypothetical protein JNK82_40200 [Myxococcaceae bacterium]|nr:hypothetical protein [Myxococcaceae bacterium]
MISAALLLALSATQPLQYTTYFYTAGEAIVQGYEAGTKVRIVSLEKKGTIWQGEVGAGDTKVVATGKGVFGFIADKKATILVGTPTSCTVVGYFVKDEKGAFRSNRFFAQLPAGGGSAQHFVLWAYDASNVSLWKPGAKEPFKSAELPAGGFLDVTGNELAAIAGQNIEVRSSGKGVAAQVYYDEGFMVPADNGRGSGKRFRVYVGPLTNQVNDLNVIAQGSDANITVRDLKAKKVLFEGKVPKGGIKTLTLSDKFVEVTSDVAVNAVVAGFEHYKAGYAEHHFQTGLEGSGIENDFMVTTSGELWLFSYFTDNVVTVTDTATGKNVFSGTLQAGAVRGLQPGFGLFKVKGTKGLSVMGGASTCGADYSPAGGMFAVDEAMFEVIAQVREERIREAAAQGKTLNEAQLQAPMTGDEWKRNASKVAPAAARPMSLEEANERAATIQQQK